MIEIRILLADSNELAQAGLQAVFAYAEGIELVGVVQDDDALIEYVKRLNPDVVLMDFTSKNLSLASIRQITKGKNAVKVIAITPEQSGRTIVDAIRAGISSYVKKDCSTQEIIESVRETKKGTQFFCNQVLETVRRESINLDTVELSDASCDPVVVSDRELEVITLIAEGYTNTQIAGKLYLSSYTIGTHRKNILAKLGVNNTAGIVMYAVKHGLVSPNKFLFSL
ncbi:MAG: DNA-binding NarL/FixJ family response regulator [Flavobacteriales bacterium]